MTRANEKPFPCEDCRFNIEGYCRRNPATPIVTSSWHEDDGKLKVRTQLVYPYIASPMSWCFAGEPKVAQSCGNCGKHRTCIWIRKLTHADWDPIVIDSGWHCSDWESEEAAE